MLELALHFGVARGPEDVTMETDEVGGVSREFDELDYNTWFKSDVVTRNMCTFVPFVFTRYVCKTAGRSELASFFYYQC